MEHIENDALKNFIVRSVFVAALTSFYGDIPYQLQGNFYRGIVYRRKIDKHTDIQSVGEIYEARRSNGNRRHDTHAKFHKY
jgi:hypothetical protein